jgi:hypothetical protein
MKYFIYISLISLSLLIAGCSKSQYDILPGRILDFNVPDTLRIGQVSTIEVSFMGGGDLCALPAFLKKDVSELLIGVKAYYKYPKGTPACLDAIPTHKLNIQIIPSRPGQFTIVATDGSGIVREVVVE